MNDLAAPGERLPYLERCEKMGFDPLCSFVRDALQKLSIPSSTGDGEIPQSEEEFLALCDMLKIKSEALEDSPQMPTRPVYEGPRHPRDFIPSEELEALYEKHHRYESRIDRAIEYGESKNYYEYIERELGEVEQEIASVENREKDKYNKWYSEQFKDYEQARRSHKKRVQLWESEAEKVKKQRRIEEYRRNAVKRIHQKVRNTFKSRPTKSLQWEPLPPGEATDDKIRLYYEKLESRGGLDGFIQERLDKALALPRKDWLIGSAGFDGYSIFTFGHTEKVLLECPIYGNAVYVINSGEERWLRMSKQELIESGGAKKIPHSGSWHQKVKKELGLQ